MPIETHAYPFACGIIHNYMLYTHTHMQARKHTTYKCTRRCIIATDIDKTDSHASTLADAHMQTQAISYCHCHCVSTAYPFTVSAACISTLPVSPLLLCVSVLSCCHPSTQPTSSFNLLSICLMLCDVAVCIWPGA